MRLDSVSRNEVPTKLDLGCGYNKSEGFYGVDITEESDADVVHDLTEFPWPLPRDHFTYIKCKAIFEHIPVSKRLRFIEEIIDISKDGAEIFLKLPHFTSVDRYRDITHREPGGLSAEVFSRHQGDGNSSTTWNNYVVKEEKIIFNKDRKIFLPQKIAEKVANYSIPAYEQTPMRVIPASAIEVTLEVTK